MIVSAKDKARLYCQISEGRVLRLARTDELLKAVNRRTHRTSLVRMARAEGALGQNIMIDIPALGRGGPVLFLQLKSTKQPRLPDICCKSTLYPVGAIRAV